MFHKHFVKMEVLENKKTNLKGGQTIVKELSSKSLGGDIERYRSHKEKGSF